jgi:TolA-binding protein
MKTWMWLGVALGVLATGAQAAPRVVFADGTEKEGTDIRANSKGDITLTTPQGTFTYTRGQYKEAIADPPAELAQIKGLLEAKNYAAAITALEAVAVKYRFLKYDVIARSQIARVHLLQNKPKEAIDALEALFRDLPEAKSDSATVWIYLQALGKGDDAAKAKLIPMLDTMVKSPNRSDAARAQIMRGDLKMAAGDVRGAAREYLRTVVLFEAEQEAQPEALFKAGDALERMKDARAKRMFGKLIKDYADSEYAAEARKRG